MPNYRLATAASIAIPMSWVQAVIELAEYEYRGELYIRERLNRPMVHSR
jgi:hypothetical protein